MIFLPFTQPFQIIVKFATDHKNIPLARVVRGGNGLTDGPALPENLDTVMKKVASKGFAHKPQVCIFNNI